MASLIKPGTVKVSSKDGEVQVSLTIDLNLSLNSDGLVVGTRSVEASYSGAPSKEKEKFEWAIPDFEDAPKIDFGKKEV